MSKASALYTWFSGFGLTAYEESNVESDPTFPYLTYTYATGDFDSGEVPIVVNIFDMSEDNTLVDSKSEEIYSAIGRGGITVPVEGGAVWMKRGSPFSQAISEPSDANIRRCYINITAEFLTA